MPKNDHCQAQSRPSFPTNPTEPQKEIAEQERASLSNLQKVDRLLDLIRVSSFSEFKVTQSEKDTILEFVSTTLYAKPILRRAIFKIMNFLNRADPESKSICFQFLKLTLGAGAHTPEYFMAFVESFDSKLAPRPKRPDSSKRVQVERLVHGTPCIEIQQASVAR